MSNDKSTNILHVSASSRHADSVSRGLGQRILSRFSHATVTERDLTTGIPAVDEIWVGATFTPAENRDDAQAVKLGFSDTLVAEVQAADVIVISTPIYNFSIPAALKAWVDQIARAGVTFAYTPEGPKGLLLGKRVIIAIASGGVPLGSDMDFASPYLRFALGFMGLTDVEFVAAAGVNADADAAIKAANTQIDTLDLGAKAA